MTALTGMDQRETKLHRGQRNARRSKRHSKAAPARDHLPNTTRHRSQTTAWLDASLDPAPGYPAFVGRHSTLAVMRERFARASPGDENLILLVGETGVGKTRLARELCTVAREEGLRAWFVPVHDRESAPLIEAWIRVLHVAHEDLGAPAFERCLSRLSWPLGQLVPELYQATAAMPSMEPQAFRFCLFEALSSFLKRASEPCPLLVVLDDIHCADDCTLELLSFLVRALHGAPVTFLATLRSGTSLASWQADVRFSDLSKVTTVVELVGLSADAVAELIAAESAEPHAELAVTLHSRTRGNPLFVCQSLALLGQPLESAGTSHVDGSSMLELQRLILARLQSLPADCQTAISAAAVIGRSFDLALLAAALAKNVNAVLELLRPAVHMGVIRPALGPGSRLVFANALVRDGLYELLPPRERGQLHRSVAAALGRRHGGDSRALTATAHHWLLALPPDLEATATACGRAAAAARAVANFESSTQLLSAALAKVEHLQAHAELSFRLLLQLGEDFFYAGRGASAWSAFRRAAEGAQSSARADLVVQVAPYLLDCVEFGFGDQDFVRNIFAWTLPFSGSLPAHLNARLLAYRAVLGTVQPAQSAQALAAQASQLAEQSDSPESKLEVAQACATIRDPRRLSDCIAAANKFLQMCERHPLVVARMRYRALRGFGAHLTRYVCALAGSDLSAADLYLEQCRQIAESSHVRLVQFVAGLLRAGRALGEGRLLELEDLIDRLSAQVDTTLEREAWRAYRLLLLEAQGGNSHQPVESDATLVDTLSGSKFLVHALILRARRTAVNGDLPRARALIANLPRAYLETMPADYGDLGTLCALAEVQLLLRDRVAMAELYEKLAPFAACNAVGPLFDYRGAVAHFLGLLARSACDGAAAHKHFREAVLINRKLSMPRQLAASEAALWRAANHAN